jgi:hypothetical protein
LQLRSCQADRVSPRAGGQAMELDRIGGKADALSRQAEHGPGMTPCHREILADSQDDAPYRVGEGMWSAYWLM